MRPHHRWVLVIVGAMALAVIALRAVLWAGWAPPHRHTETGVDDYRGIEREYAASAVEQAKVQNNGAIRVPS